MKYTQFVHELNQLVDEINRLTIEYQMEDRVLVESEVSDFLYYLKKRNPKIQTYLASLGDFELGVSRALGAGYSEISFHFKHDEEINKELVALMRRNGLKIQLWTVNDPIHMQEALLLKPDFIQTDNITP